MKKKKKKARTHENITFLTYDSEVNSFVFPRVLMFPSTSQETSGLLGFEAKQTARLCPVRDTFKFDQKHITKNQPVTVLVLLSESLGI